MIKVHVSAENRYNICIISTKGVLFSPVSICLMVGWLAAGLDKNYGTDFNETWMKFVSLSVHPNKGDVSDGSRGLGGDMCHIERHSSC